MMWFTDRQALFSLRKQRNGTEENGTRQPARAARVEYMADSGQEDCERLAAHHCSTSTFDFDFQKAREIRGDSGYASAVALNMV